MPKVMLNLKLAPRDRNLANIREKLNLSPGEVDPNFGVVVIDPKKNLCTILVEESAANRVKGNKDVAGPYANPVIEPFGPPQK